MIPLFTPATARKDVNKTYGDGELAKLANLNRLVENVNTIVAQGIPAAGPTLTYTNVGPLTAMGVSFNVVVDPTAIPNSGGSKTVQSYYVPQIALNNNGGANASLTSISFPDIEIGGSFSVEFLPVLTSVSLPKLTKLLSGTFTVQGYDDGDGTINYISNLSAPLLDYVSGSFNIGTVSQSIYYPLLTQVGGYVNVYDVPTVDLPLLNYVGGSINISNLTDTNAIVNFPSLLYYGVDPGEGGTNINVGNCDLIDSINFSSLVEVINEIRLEYINGLGSVDFSSLETNTPTFVQVGGLTDITFPSLTIDNSSFEVRECNDLESINTPVLVNGGFYVNDNVSLTTINAPLFQTGIVWFVGNALSSISLPSMTGGNSSIRISDDSITSISFSSLVSTDGSLRIIDTPSLTSFSAPNYTGITSPDAETVYFINVGLTTLNLPVLSLIDPNLGQKLYIEDSPNLVTINAPLLTSGAEVTLINLPLLTTISSSLSNLRITDLPAFTSFSTSSTTAKVIITSNDTNSALSSINAPNATSFDLQDYRTKSLLTSISAPLATDLTFFRLQGVVGNLAPLTSVTLSSVTDIGYLTLEYTEITSFSLSTAVNYSYIGNLNYNIKNNPNLTSLTLGTIGTLKNISINSGFQLNLSGNALDVASVNAVLALLVSLDGTNGTTLFTSNVSLNGGTNAAPTGQGLIDKATLQARGCTVTTN